MAVFLCSEKLEGYILATGLVRFDYHNGKRSPFLLLGVWMVTALLYYLHIKHVWTMSLLGLDHTLCTQAERINEIRLKYLLPLNVPRNTEFHNCDWTTDRQLKGYALSWRSFYTLWNLLGGPFLVSYTPLKFYGGPVMFRFERLLNELR